MFDALEREVVPQMHEQISECVTKSSGEVYANVTKQCQESAQTLQAFGKRLDSVEAMVPAHEKKVEQLLQAMRGEFKVLADERLGEARAQLRSEVAALQQALVDSIAARDKKEGETVKKLVEELSALKATVKEQHEENEALRGELAVDNIAARNKKEGETVKKLVEELSALKATVKQQHEENEALRGELAALKASVHPPPEAENVQPRGALALVQPLLVPPTTSEDDAAKLRGEIRRLGEIVENLASEHKAATGRHDESWRWSADWLLAMALWSLAVGTNVKQQSVYTRLKLT
jgi:regulator of replication initiation timing